MNNLFEPDYCTPDDMVELNNKANRMIKDHEKLAEKRAAFDKLYSDFCSVLGYPRQDYARMIYNTLNTRHSIRCTLRSDLLMAE